MDSEVCAVDRAAPKSMDGDKACGRTHSHSSTAPNGSRHAPPGTASRPKYTPQQTPVPLHVHVSYLHATFARLYFLRVMADERCVDERCVDERSSGRRRKGLSIQDVLRCSVEMSPSPKLLRFVPACCVHSFTKYPVSIVVRAAETEDKLRCCRSHSKLLLKRFQILITSFESESTISWKSRKRHRGWKNRTSSATSANLCSPSMKQRSIFLSWRG